jgi:hypothetical protein
MSKKQSTAEAPLTGGIADDAGRRERLAALGLGISLNGATAPAVAPELKRETGPSNEERWDQHQRTEAYHAELRANDPHANRAERRRQAKLANDIREGENDRNLPLLFLKGRGLITSKHYLGAGDSPEAVGAMNTFQAEVELELYIEVNRAMDEAAAKVIAEAYGRIPALAEEVEGHYNRYLKQLAERREAEEEAREKKSAAGLSPTQVVELLRREGITLKLDEEGEIMIAPASRVDRRVRALVKINAPGLVELLKGQQDFARV